MMNVDAGRQHIRRLPDRRLLGKLTPTPEGFTRLIGMMPSAIWHGYTGRRTAGSAAHTALALYDVPGRGIELRWNYSTGGQFSADDCGERW